MKILVRRKDTESWRKVEPRGYDNEAQLEELLERSPDLLPTDPWKPVLFFRRQVGLGQNAVDLVGVDADGNITLVECKLESNREARRMVVAQVLEYAAQLWDTSFEEFEGLLTQNGDISLPELIRKKVEGGWSEEGFRATVERNLERGTFRLVIAVNGITKELERILEYVNSRGGVRLEALELRQFSDENNEVLVPQLYGVALPVEHRNERSVAPRREMDQVFDSAETREIGRRLKRFVDGWISAGHEAVPGTSGISFRATRGDISESIFVALTPNFFSFHRPAFKRRGISQEAIEEFLAAAGALPCSDPAKFATQSGPRIYISEMTDADADNLLQAALTMVKKWQDS